ncbi:hypothetical protein [Solidesulfovibrio magneticus]|uniref:Uncharacterized protein n=1 Tax=Solidesulfovibrio magneticus (strain ATCC 700980 / DSM 13731 / RS-1) TaxID=573370 RepID=C4XTB7_SOLM1|nr:hypothetical protein [Solidesulfovibrio magneticus]BAH75914.1 hypothetical protein DMR_24230 [Solidesulfovibrio magneticus RS-1]
MSLKVVDVAVNALGKPFQTTLSILSLLKHSHKYIDKIYLIAENANTPRQLNGFEFIKNKLKSRLIFYVPKNFYWIRLMDVDSIIEEDARLSVRYQYAWERTDKDYLYICHNDTYHKQDIVGLYLDKCKEHIGAGNVGACAGCPAYHAKKCSGEKYLSYRPTYQELFDLYEKHDFEKFKNCTPFHLANFCEAYRSNPWPLPPCRINEWSCLINMRLVRSVTSPLGSVPPFGCIASCGGYGVDTGALWFHDVHRFGYAACHCDISDYIDHGCGHQSMLDQDVYYKNEERAKQKLQSEFGINPHAIIS